jgi:RNA polymerase sigma-70 factor (ECF subfamily)
MTRKAFNDIIHQYYRKLYLIAFRIIKNRQEAEDIVQNVFIRMWSMGDKLDSYRDVEALAVTITKNNCIDLLRKMKHIEADISWHEIPAAEFSPSPHDQLVRNETSAILTMIINGLPPQYRDVVLLREIDGLSYEEISKQKNININSLRVNLSRARSMIRDEYIKQTNERGETKRTSGTVL